MIKSLRGKLVKNGCYDTGRERKNKAIKSGYFDRENRREVYRRWLGRKISTVGARPNSPQNDSEDAKAEESLTRLVSYALKSLGESIHKSLTDCLLLKSRSGVYQDNAENRRLHRVGQRYGGEARPTFNKEEQRTFAVEQFRDKAEKFLSSMGGVDFRYIGSSMTNGASVYFKVSRKDGKGVTLKFRISDHSVTNRDRVLDEVHYGNSDPEQTRNEIYYRLGFPEYKYGKTIVTMPSGRKLEAFGYYKEEHKPTFKSLVDIYLLKF